MVQSYLNYLQNGFSQESQYGYTDAECMTTRNVEVNLYQLWFTNTYEVESKYDDNFKFVLFIICGIYAGIIVIYNLFMTIMDLVYVKKEKLHSKSIAFNYKKIANQININAENSNSSSNGCRSKVTLFWKRIHSFWKKNFRNDTIFWLVMSFLCEIIEFVLQSLALLLYNGYNSFDPDHEEDVYLAAKSEFIIVFAGILCFNCFGSEILWLSYSLADKYLNVLWFKLLIYLVDQLSDLFYAIFPFIIIMYDNYNKNTNDIMVLLGQLNLTSNLAFYSAFIPLFFSCNKCLFISKSATNGLRNCFYNEWIKTQPEIGTISAPRETEENMYDAQQKQPDTHLGKVNQTLTWIKRLILMFISIGFVLYGLYVFTSTLSYFYEAEPYCDSIMESKFIINGSFVDLNNSALNFNDSQYKLLETNPELFLYDKCQYKVYPFTNDGNYNCQCRVFVMDWNDLQTNKQERKQYLNLNQQDLLYAALSHWYMLEKFWSLGIEPGGAVYTEYHINESMLTARNMKAFELDGIRVTRIDERVSNWERLQYFTLKETLMDELPESFGGLLDLRYLHLRVRD